MTRRGLATTLAAAALLAGMSGCAATTASRQAAAAPASDAPAELTPDRALALSLKMAAGQEQAGNDAAAREELEKALHFDPNNATALHRLAVLYDKECEFGKAEATYRKLARATPKDAELFADWGYSFYLRNNWADSERQLRHALTLDPHNARACGNLGLTLGQTGRYEEALQAFRAAGIGEAEARCDVAFVYWSQGRLDDARRECRAAREQDGFCAKAKEMLARLDPPTQPGVPATSADVLPAAHRAPPGEIRVPPQPPVSAAPPADAVPDATPVYRSPNGTAWVPVPRPAAVPEGTTQPAE
jgi:type IV pilus assembly protein PilF